MSLPLPLLLLVAGFAAGAFGAGVGDLGAGVVVGFAPSPAPLFGSDAFAAPSLPEVAAGAGAPGAASFFAASW